MTPQLDAIEQQHTADRPESCTRRAGRPADQGRRPARVSTNVLRNITGVILSGAVLAHSSPAQAQVAPFGIPCNSVGVAGIPYVPGVNCRLIAVDGYTRRYVVWVPPGGVAANAAAVFMLHGGSGTGEQFLGMSGWRQKATQEGFIAIFPTAVEHFVLETQRFSTRWNNYSLPGEIDPNRRPAGYPAASPWPADDVQFIRQIGQDAIQQLQTDPRRVYVAGFSSGGAMCARLGIEASDVIAAVACHGSGFHELHKTLAGQRNPSIYLSLGTLDDNALTAINDYRIALGLMPIPSLPLNPADLHQIPQITTQILLNIDSFNLDPAQVTAAAAPLSIELHAQTPQPGNSDGNELYFTFLEGVTHQYPNGTNNSHGFNLPDLVWPFFVQHPR
ncbi:MAG: PHB depolymerase family esterase [Acidobacteriota bacterium]